MDNLENLSDLSIFEQIKKIDENGNEYWSARNLSKILSYVEYRNFLPVVSKAKQACELSNHSILDHFVDFHDMVDIGSKYKLLPSFFGTIIDKYYIHLLT